MFPYTSVLLDIYERIPSPSALQCIASPITRCPGRWGALGGICVVDMTAGSAALRAGQHWLNIVW